jgi:hypothetical protein
MDMGAAAMSALVAMPSGWPIDSVVRMGAAMKYLKLVWLIMSGRLQLETRSRRDRNEHLEPATYPKHAYSRTH